MRICPRLLGLSVVVSLVGAVACSSATEPSASMLRGTFVVADVNGAALPAAISTTATSRVVLVADTLSFDGFESAEQSTTTRQASPGAASSESHRSVGLIYKVTRDSIRLGIACPPNANCTPFTVGHVVNRDIFTLTYGANGYLYVRR